MKNTICAVASACAVALLFWPGAALPASAQPILERLEKKIRNRLAQPAATDQAGAPAATPAKKPAQQPAAKTGSQPGYLGVVADDKQDRGRGVRVLDVRPGGPAEKGGLRKGDLITGAAGVRVRQMSDLADILAMFRAGDPLECDVLRGVQQVKVKIALGRRAPPAGAPEAVPPPPPVQAPTAPTPPPATGPKLPAPNAVVPPPTTASQIEQLQRRVEQLERRVAELEKALAEKVKKQ